MNKYYYSDGSVLNWNDFNRALHRLDGPAIEHDIGYKVWYQNDRLHRLDGPAVEYEDGRKFWYINDKHLTKEEFEKHILIMKLSGLLYG